MNKKIYQQYWDWLLGETNECPVKNASDIAEIIFEVALRENKIRQECNKKNVPQESETFPSEKN